MKNNLTYKKPKITKIDFEHRLIEQEFDGFRILHLSDLHNKEFGLNQSILIEISQESKPDLIAITGDIINGQKIDKTLLYIKEAVNVAPVFFVSGNHEYYSKRYNFIKDQLVNAGARVLDNRLEEITVNSKILSVIGIRDLAFFKNKEAFKNTINTLSGQAKGFRIMLTHKPHLIDAYQNSGADLILSGHAHGGQVRLPLIGGLYAPGQGVFPRYTSGLYRLKNGVSMIVNRGLGDSKFPWRINNPAHLILITLKPKKNNKSG
ncbi:MAG TPA: metallophosphoesterase [Clostridiales bacterium]|jgi:predicted MPP superfamily phosphohydrolase|nr:metallophosphoesterase [Clostridiales bacterium]